MQARRSATLAVMFVFACALVARAQSTADFYSGKTISLVVGSEPGGTYDLYARTIARHLGSHIPGEPKVIVQNVPGAGSYLAARRVYSLAPQDGTVIGALGAALPYQPLIDPGAPPLEVNKINWLPSVSSYHMVMLVRGDVPVYSVDDLRKRAVLQATIAPGQANSLIVAAVNDALGTKIKGIAGHKSLNDSMLALKRGEIEGYPSMPVDALKRLYAKDLAEGKIRLLLQFGSEPVAEFKDVPWAPGLAPDPKSRMVLDLTTGFLRTGYVYMMGPDVPKERVELMREAMRATYQDPNFLADAKKQILTVAPVSAKRVTDLFTEAYATPPDVVDRIRRLFKQAE